MRWRTAYKKRSRREKTLTGFGVRISPLGVSLVTSAASKPRLKLQCRDRVGGRVDDNARKQSEHKHAEHAEAEGNFDGRGNLDGRQIGGVFGPIDRPHDAEVVVKRNHHTDDGQSDEPVV